MAKKTKEPDISFEEKPVDYEAFVRAAQYIDIPNVHPDIRNGPWDTPGIKWARRAFSVGLAENFNDVSLTQEARRYSELPDNVLMAAHSRSQEYANQIRAGRNLALLGGGVAFWTTAGGLMFGFNSLLLTSTAISAVGLGLGVVKMHSAIKSMDSLNEAVNQHAKPLPPAP